jgi:hypothetical protein
MELAASLQVHDLMGYCKNYKNSANLLSCSKKRHASNWWQARVLPWQYFEYEQSFGETGVPGDILQQQFENEHTQKKWMGGGGTGGLPGGT